MTAIVLDPPNTDRARIALTRGQLWLALGVLLPTLGALLSPLSTVDLAYQLRLGADIGARASIPVADSYTFTAFGHSWVDQQWASQVVLAAVFATGGWGALAVLRAAVVALISALVARACRSAGVGAFAAGGLALASFAIGLESLNLRPQLFGMLCFAAAVTLVVEHRAHPRRVWLLPVVAAVWANVHGSFILAPLLAAIPLADDVLARRWPGRSSAVVIATVLATLATPFGFATWSYVADLSTNPQVRELVTEWQPVVPLSYAGLALVISTAGLIALIVMRSRDLRARLPWLALAAVTLASAVLAVRGIAWWALTAPIVAAALCAPVSTGPLGKTQSDPTPARAFRGYAAVVALLVVAVVAALPGWRGDPTRSVLPVVQDAPVVLSDALAERAAPGDRVFNSQRWGSWIEYAVPHARVMVDSRVELIPRDTWRVHGAISAASPGWQQSLTGLGVRFVLVANAEQPRLAAAIAPDEGWRLVATNGEGSLYERTSQ